MKKLIALSIFCLGVLTLKAQTVTNIAYRITVETGTVGGSTNSVNTNLRLDYGTNKDLTRINGFVFAWNAYKASGGTNTIGDWLKTDVKDRADAYAATKNVADNAALLARLQTLLMSNPDLLSASDLSNLQAIAAKAP